MQQTLKRASRLQNANFRTTLSQGRSRFKLQDRSRQPTLASRVFRRNESTGDHHSGHIVTGPNEGVLFFNNVWPLSLQWMQRLGLQSMEEQVPPAQDPKELFNSAIPQDERAKVTGITPRYKDGAAFLRFSHSSQVTNTDIERAMLEYLDKKRHRPWWSFASIEARLVLGKPWIEDLYRPPYRRLKVEFIPRQGDPSSTAVSLSQEQLYSVFRSYGKLLEIHSQPFDSKELPKYALIDFADTKKAIMAKNCLHGFTFRNDETGEPLAKLKISYTTNYRMVKLKDWMMNHPRIVIPLLIALAAGFGMFVFDPMRKTAIKFHITRTLQLENSYVYRAYEWLTSRAQSLLHTHASHNQDASLAALRQDRKEAIEQIEKWLSESTDTFIVVQGPRGSGKRELVVDQALKERKYKLIVDCKRIQDARGDTSTIDATAASVGYAPVFSWVNSMSGLIDLAAQGAAGVKTGFSETLDGQLSKILTTTSSALRSLALDSRSKQDKDAKISEDDYLEAHPEMRPVVVIDNFLHKASENSVIYDKMAQWAADLTSANVAHVIFLTTDVSFSKSLSKALPDRVFRQLSLGDLPTDAAKRFVMSHLDAELGDVGVDPKEHPLTAEQRRHKLGQQKSDLMTKLDEVIPQLGGRLTDLEFLARRIKAKETPEAAVRGIIDQTASEIIKMYLMPNSSEAGRKWSPTQAWTIIKEIARQDPQDSAAAKHRPSPSHSHSQPAETDGPTLRYNEVLLNPVFGGGLSPDQVLSSLEAAELITIHSHNGRPTGITPSRPVFLPAFRQIAADRVLQARLDIAIFSDRIKAENAGIDKCEEELRTLGVLFPGGVPAQMRGRVGWLLGKVDGGQRKLEELEREVGRLKGVLSSEF